MTCLGGLADTLSELSGGYNTTNTMDFRALVSSQSAQLKPQLTTWQLESEEWAKTWENERK